MQDREHQGSGAEGFPAHVGKDRDTETAQDEAGVEHTAQGLQMQWRTCNDERSDGSWLLTLELHSGQPLPPPQASPTE